MPSESRFYKNGHLWRTIAAAAAGTAIGIRAAQHGVPPNEAMETGKNAGLLTLGFGYGVANRMGATMARLPLVGKALENRGEETAVAAAATVTVAEMAAPHALGDPVNGAFLILGAGAGLATRRMSTRKSKK